jgi:hypothetical protein
MEHTVIECRSIQQARFDSQEIALELKRRLNAKSVTVTY